MTVPDKLELASMDVISEKQQLLRRAIRESFPEVYSDGKIDMAQLQRLLGDWSEVSKERFGLNWAGKSECVKVIQKPSAATLKPARDDSVNFDATENIFIEGDNLETLKALQKSYFGKVKMIYIDPPYNTGNEFIYPDKYSETLETYLEYTGQTDSSGRKLSTNSDAAGRYHSRWLSMMYPRLYIAKNLLRDDGFIFVSIDDHEQANLKLLLDEVFGEENFRGKVSRATGTPSGQGNNILVNEVDYVFLYAKSEEAKLKGLPFTAEDGEIYDQEDQQGKYLTRPLRKTGGEDRRGDRPTMYFAISDPDGNPYFPLGPGGYESRWRCGPDTYQSLIDSGRIEWKKGIENGNPTWKVYQKFYLEGREKQPSNLWDDLEGNKKASLDVKKLFGSKVFDFPKPVGFLERCLDIATSEGDLVLDFFAGSGTLAHAVMRKNFVDAKRLKFILIQLPEPCDEASEAFQAGYLTIADICKDRIRLAGKIFAEEEQLRLKLSASPQNDFGFSVFKLSRSCFKTWDELVQDFDHEGRQLDLHVEHVDQGCSDEDILYELLLRSGFELSTKINIVYFADKKVFSVQGGALLICLEKEITSDLIDALAAANPLQVICLDEGFKSNDQLKANAVQTFKARAQAEESEIVLKTV